MIVKSVNSPLNCLLDYRLPLMFRDRLLECRLALLSELKSAGVDDNLVVVAVNHLIERNGLVDNVLQMIVKNPLRSE